MSHCCSTVQEFDLIATVRPFRPDWTGLDLPQCELGHTPAVAGETHNGAESLRASWKTGETPDTDGLCGVFFGSQSQGASVGTSRWYNLQMSRQKTHLLVLNGDTGLAPPPCQSKCPVRVRASRVFWVGCVKKVFGIEGASAATDWLRPLHASFMTLRPASLTFSGHGRLPTFHPPPQNPSEAHQSHQFRH